MSVIEARKEGLEIIEQQIRCFSCDKFLTKTKVQIYFNPAMFDGTGLTLAAFFSRMEVQIRFAAETKCPRCKGLDSKLIFAV